MPLLGFGNTRWKGVKKAVDEEGLLGIFKGGLTASSAGICAAMVFGYLASLVSHPKLKKETAAFTAPIVTAIIVSESEFGVKK